MDRLVNADVKELEVIFKPGEKCGGAFRLTNLMHAISVAVSLTSDPENAIEFTKQPLAVIPPLSSLPFSILFGPTDSPPLRSPPHAVTVRSAMIPTGKATTEDLRRIFSSAGRHVFVDAVIPVSFVGPDVVRFVAEADPELGLVAPFLAGALSGCTALQVDQIFAVAVQRGNFGAVSTMIAAGACVDGVDTGNGRSLLSLAAESGSMETAKLLLASGASINATDSDGRTPVHVAAGEGHMSVLDFLLSAGGEPDARDKRGRTALHEAAAKGRLSAAERLLRQGACKYVVDGEGKAPYGVAAESGHGEGPMMAALRLDDALKRAARVGDEAGVRGCLDGGAAADGRDRFGWTPLHTAALKGWVECARALIAGGAVVDVGDGEGYTPLRCAVEAGHGEVAALLREHGGCVGVTRRRGKAPPLKSA